MVVSRDVRTVLVTVVSMDEHLDTQLVSYMVELMDL